MSTNQPLSTETDKAVKGELPKGEGEYSGWAGGPEVEYFKQLTKDISFSAYKFPDGSTGAALYSKAWAFHADNNNNFIFTAGPPSQGGCGGKLIQKTEAIVQQTGSVSTHVTGRKEDGVVDKKVKDGDVEESKLPAYSLKVEGDIFIESVGGEVALKGDVITLNALNTLNLKSGKDINIQAGDNSGKVTINCSKYDLNAAFLNKNVTGGEYSKGSGENEVEQYNSGSTTTLSTPGSVNYVVNGDYTVGVKGDYKQIVDKNYSIESKKDYAIKIDGDYSMEVGGKAKTIFNGVNKQSTQKEAYLMKIGASTKNIPGFLIDSDSQVKIQTAMDGIVVETSKQTSKLELNQKEFIVSVGKKMGELAINQLESKLSFGQTASISMSASKTSIKGTAIYLN